MNASVPNNNFHNLEYSFKNKFVAQKHDISYSLFFIAYQKLTKAIHVWKLVRNSLVGVCFHTTKHNAKETCDGMRVQPAAITFNPLRNGNPRYVCSMNVVVRIWVDLVVCLVTRGLQRWRIPLIQSEAKLYHLLLRNKQQRTLNLGSSVFLEKRPLRFGDVN